MDEPVKPDEEQEPFGQRFFNSPFLLLLLGLVVMFGIESPGLTSSLAIGELAADLLGA